MKWLARLLCALVACQVLASPVPVTPTLSLQGAKQKTIPSHGGLLLTTWAGAANFAKLRQPLYAADATRLNGNFKFYELLVHWSEIETSFNTYTTAAFSQDLAYLGSMKPPRYLVIKVATYGSGQQPANSVPAYIYPAGKDPNYSAAAYGPGYYSSDVAGQQLWRAAYWMPGVQQRYLALMQFLATKATVTVNGVTYVGLDNNPYVLGIIFDEESQPSNVGQAVAGAYGTTGANAYTAASWIAGYQATIGPAAAQWKQTNFVVPFNQIPQLTASSAVPNAIAFGNTITAARAAYGAPDLLPLVTTPIPYPGGPVYQGEMGVAVYLGELGNTPAKGVVDYFAQIEQDDMDGSFGTTPSCAALFQYSEITLGARYIAWPVDTSSSAPVNVQWVPTITNFINANPITVH
jgi:hypothetical protein